jgi:hypothetical protein
LGMFDRITDTKIDAIHYFVKSNGIFFYSCNQHNQTHASLLIGACVAIFASQFLNPLIEIYQYHFTNN